jgi:valyl-tRNA synthetase
MDSLQSVVTQVRRFRADQGLKPAQSVSARLIGLGGVDLAGYEPLMRSLVRLDQPGADFMATATLSLAGGVEVELDTRGAIDVGAERARLTKDEAAAVKEVAQCQSKLDDQAFLDKAPEAVVTKIRERLAAAEADLVRVRAALAALAG